MSVPGGDNGGKMGRGEGAGFRRLVWPGCNPGRAVGSAHDWMRGEGTRDFTLWRRRQRRYGVFVDMGGL